MTPASTKRTSRRRKDDAQNPAGWPDELLAPFERSLIAEFVTVSKKGFPIATPLTPYVGSDRQTIDVQTGILYPAKAERARRNPKVAVLFSEWFGSELKDPPMVLVQGMAAVRDSDIQSNTDLYIRRTSAKLPQLYGQLPKEYFLEQYWYWPRIWILIAPLRMVWWPKGEISGPARQWRAPADLPIPRSDPAPPGRPWSWSGPPPLDGRDWRRFARSATEIGTPLLSVIDADGFPYAFRVPVELTDDGFVLDLGSERPLDPSGPACLTFHTIDETYIYWPSRSFLGQVERERGRFLFRPERALASFQDSTEAVGEFDNAFGKMRERLLPHLEAECRRRGQPVPEIRPPHGRWPGDPER